MITSDLIKAKAYKIGFDLVGFSSVDNIKLYQDNYMQRIDAKFENKTLYPRNKMDYHDYLNVDKMLNNTQTIISVGINFNQHRTNKQANEITYSKTSFGQDYHHLLSSMIEKLLSELKNEFSFKSFYSIDTKIIDDRFFAYLCGNGFYGKNTMIINPTHGSMVFYGTILIDEQILINEDITPLDSLCKDCDLCQSACPTQSLKAYNLNYQSCLSHLTQSKVMVSHHLIKDNIYGCDICNDICPFNQSMSKHTELKDRQVFDVESFIHLSNQEYNELFKPKSLGWLNKNIIKKNAILSLANYQRDLASLKVERALLIKNKGSDLLIKAYNLLIERREKNEV